jgi:hypothetical protein
VQKVEGKKKKKFKKNGDSPTRPSIDPTGRESTLGPVGLSPFFFLIYCLKIYIFWKFGKWAKAFGRMGVQHPHFFKLAPTLGSVNPLQPN